MKDYQLVQKSGQNECESQSHLGQYLQHFVFITSHLLQTSVGSSLPEAVEASWVLSLTLKGLYRMLKVQSTSQTITEQ